MGNRNVFEEGVDAFASGKPRDACPYPTSDARHAEWLDGWDKAKRGDELYVDGEP